MKILYIAARDLLSPDSPRAASIVMRINLLSKQHDVYVVFSQDEPRAESEIRRTMPGIVSYTLLRTPAGSNLFERILYAFAKRLPFQVASCFDSGNIQVISALAANTKFDAIFYDTVRSLLVRQAMPVQRGRKDVLDADDLFSLRYSDLARSSERSAFLGNFARRVPAAFVPLARRLSFWILRREARCMRRLEMTIPGLFDHVVFVSDVEAQRLRDATGRKNISAIYQFIPGIIEKSTAAPTGPGSNVDVYFLGNFLSPANLASIKLIAGQVWPLVRAQVPNARLHVVGGHMPAALRNRLEGEGILFAGYVADLDSIIKDFGILLSPMGHGTGIKTKIVEAMWRGKAVVTNSAGIRGLRVVPGEHCLVSESPEDLARYTISLLKDAGLRAEIGRSARECIVQSFEPHGLIREWQSVIAPKTGAAKGNSGRYLTGSCQDW